jgi:hypothetical protein
MRNRVFAGIAALGLLAPALGCEHEIATGGTTKTEMEQTESNQSRLVKATPPPQFNQSLERENLVERLKRLNVANKIGYVYLLGNQGQVVAFYTIKGKVSSLNSLLTTPDQIVRIPATMGEQRYVTLPSPDFDGSYGKNPEGIFFFTTSDALVEYSGNYLYSDQPLKITTPVSLQATVDLEKKRNK